MQTVEDLTTLSERINEICVRSRITDYMSTQSFLKGGSLLTEVAKPMMSLMDVVLKGGALSDILTASSKWSQSPLESIILAKPPGDHCLLNPSVATLASMETQTCMLACKKGITQLTSVASQISSISDMLASQSGIIRELIAPTSMLSDLRRIAEDTHKTILDAGNLTPWQVGVLDSASFMVDRHVDWASRFCSTLLEEELLPQSEQKDEYSPEVNMIKLLPEELEYEHRKNKEITPSKALELTSSFQMSELGKGLIERIVNINKTCQRKKLKPIFSYTNATMMAATNLGGTVCTNNGSFGIIIDGLYFFFYENLKHIKEVLSEEAVRNEDIFQCIFRVKDMRSDLRHDFEHGDKIEKKMDDIARSYLYYTGKVTPTTSADYIKVQKGLFKDFYMLAEYLQDVVERQA